MLLELEQNIAFCEKLIFDLNDDENFDTKLIVTGAHLSERYGHTINEIFADRIPIFKTIDLII